MLLVYLGLGLVAGVLSGLFGIGGGLLIVPGLMLAARFPIKLALGTSLGALLLPVGLLGAYTYWKHGHVDVRAAVLIAAGLTGGAFVGARMAQTIPAETLQRMFAVFMLAMAVHLWVKAGAA